MKWYEIMRMIVVIWPIIESIINSIDDENKKNEAKMSVAKEIQKALTGTTTT